MATKSSANGIKSSSIDDSPTGIYRTALLNDVLGTVTIPDRDAVANELTNDYMAPFFDNIASIKSEINDSFMQSSSDLFDISKNYARDVNSLETNINNGKYALNPVTSKDNKPITNGSALSIRHKNNQYSRKRRFSADNISDVEHQIALEDLSENNQSLFDLSGSHSIGVLLPSKQINDYVATPHSTKDEFPNENYSEASLPGVRGSANKTSSPRIDESNSQLDVSRQAILGQPCPICGDKISGFHYGIYSCESCKGFFKRTVQNKKNYMCMRGNNCVVSMVTRKKCPACRFRKCLNTGMKLEGNILKRYY